MNVLVVGAGAVGLGVGSCLLAAGVHVRFVTKSGGAEPLRSRGLLRRGIFGEVFFDPGTFEVGDDLSLEVCDVDFALVCTKTTASEEVARILGSLPAVARGDVRVVLLHNGWGSAEVFARWIPRHRVFNARVITGFRRTAPHEVEVTVHADAIRMGSLFDGNPEELTPLSTAIDTGGIPCELSVEVQRDLWAKMLYNCALNPLGALHDIHYGVLAEREVTRRLMDAVMDEIFAVMAPHGIATHWDSAEKYRRVFYDELLPPTASHESSMVLDLRAGRPTEVDALCGAVAELGRRAGVPTPVNSALRDLLRAATAGAG